MYPNLDPPIQEDNSYTGTVWIPIEVTVEQGCDDIITFAGKNLDEYEDIEELKAYIKELTNKNR